MRHLALPALLVCLSLSSLPAQAGSVTFTGDVYADFSAGAGIVSDTVEAIMPSGAPAGTLSGFDFERVFVEYDPATDTLFVGVVHAGRSGDADQDGNDASASAAWLSACGGSDTNWGYSEGTFLTLDVNRDYVWDVWVGLQFGQPYTVSTVDIGSYGGAYYAGSPLSSNIGSIYQYSGSPTDLEFSIRSYSTLPGAWGSRPTTSSTTPLIGGQSYGNDCSKKSVSGRIIPLLDYLGSDVNHVFNGICLDTDLDGFTTCAGDCDDTDPGKRPFDYDGDGLSTCAGDCDDGAADARPGAPELCDGYDNDCDGSIDEVALCAPCTDSDADGVCDEVDPCPADKPDDADGDGVCTSEDICAGGDDMVDGDGDGNPDDCDECPGDASDDGDGDGWCEDEDPCPGDALNDADGDGICSAGDRCPGFDDAADIDGDGQADGCDLCPADPADDSDADGSCDSFDICDGHADYLDADGDGVPDGCDICPMDALDDQDADGACDSDDDCPVDPLDDSDGDGSCDSEDACPGADDRLDTDGDGAADGCDLCPMDALDDADGDGSCDSEDACPGADDTLDTDGDGVADGCDLCPIDALDDSDGDGACDSEDPCPADPADDSDGDGTCDSVDICEGGDDLADADGDGTPDDCDSCPLDLSDDSDGDGRCDSDDACPDSPAGASVDPTGCALADLCDCDAPGQTHSSYVKCVGEVTTQMVGRAEISGKQRGQLISEAARSTCGR